MDGQSPVKRLELTNLLRRTAYGLAEEAVVRRLGGVIQAHRIMRRWGSDKDAIGGDDGDLVDEGMSESRGAYQAG